MSLEDLYESVKNWGRWGDDDERGALNHLTPERTAAAAGTVRHGRTVSLAHDLAVQPTAENPFPVHHHMLTAGDARDNMGIPGYEAARDYVGCHVHGLGVTHVDALCHMFVNGEMYNGVPHTEVRSDGATTNTVLSLADGVVGRGVLFDIAAVRGVDVVPPDEPATLADFEAAETMTGLTVGPGDILIVGTGRDAMRAAAGGTLNPAQGMAGVHHECLPWMREREISVLGSDGISDPMPGAGVPGWTFPIHQIGIVAMGLHLIDNLALGELSAACAELGQWEFLFTMGALRVPGGTGCPVNPTAVL